MLNIGGAGAITVHGTVFEMAIGRGNEQIAFASVNSDQPAEFYFLSYPAHALHPTTFLKTIVADTSDLGAPVHLTGVPSCQLVMGFTTVATDSNWNTKIYLYFDRSEADRVIHLTDPLMRRVTSWWRTSRL